jgi:phage I-like protein
MHFKDDRVDRDALEPAARRVDELMNMFASTSNDPARVAVLSSEIQTAIDKVPNPKVAAALSEARAEIAAILGAIEAEVKASHAGIDSTSPLRPFG